MIFRTNIADVGQLEAFYTGLEHYWGVNICCKILHLGGLPGDVIKCSTVEPPFHKPGSAPVLAFTHMGNCALLPHKVCFM